MSTNYKPLGYHSITPYLIVEKTAELIEFLKDAFGAIEIEKMQIDSGRITHAEVKIGDSVLMMADAMENFPPMPTSLYLYVPNTDDTYNTAINAGGTSLMEPADQFYGDRNAGVLDPAGNRWWIGTHFEDVSKEELERRAKERYK